MGEWRFLRGLSLSFFIPKNDTVVNRKDFPRSYQESREDGKTFGEAFAEKNRLQKHLKSGRSLVKKTKLDTEGIDPSTFRMQSGRSTTDLSAQIFTVPVNYLNYTQNLMKPICGDLCWSNLTISLGLSLSSKALIMSLTHPHGSIDDLSYVEDLIYDLHCCSLISSPTPSPSQQIRSDVRRVPTEFSCWDLIWS
jgi:hypothetical protein